MERTRCRRWLWCLPPVVLCGYDGCLTLWGQPPAYWANGYTTVRESNPLAAWFLTVHPLAFAASGVPYVLGVAWAILRLPWPWYMVLSATVALAHAVAVLAWTMVLADEGLGFGVLWVPASAVVLTALWWAGLRHCRDPR
jgi:hypothetical protein